MTRKRTVADRLAEALGAVLGTTDLPVRLRGWDGSITGPAGAPVVAVNSRRALRRMVWAPGQLGLGRAYVAGEIDMEDDVFATFAALRSAGRLNQEGPAFAQTLNAVSALLSTEAMRRMNAAVVLDKQSPSAVASAFLKANNLK